MGLLFGSHCVVVSHRCLVATCLERLEGRVRWRGSSANVQHAVYARLAVSFFSREITLGNESGKFSSN